jgi:nitrate/nitrite transport system substrate-binding protein
MNQDSTILMPDTSAKTQSGSWVSGSDAPEMKEVKVGYIPLTDCASVVIASVMKFDEKFGIKIILSKEASWSAVRDKLLNGTLHAAHVLYGLVYGVHMGIGGQKKDMSVLMTLSNNGQGITLSNQLKDKGVTEGNALKKLLDSEKRDYTFAQTFPTGTHAMWLYYWLANYGIHPLNDVKMITVPPPLMVAQMRMAHIDGFCVGEPWNNRAIYDKIGFTAATTQDIWPDHPEKVLGCTAEFSQQYPNTSRALIMALLEASRYIDTMSNRHEVSEIIAARAYLDCPVEVIDRRMAGEYEDGLGRQWDDPHYMKFYNEGMVNFPYLSDGMWFLTQHKRWGLLKEDPDYLAVARQINQIELYQQAASRINVPVPEAPMRTSRLMDDKVWDGSNPNEYAASFSISA